MNILTDKKNSVGYQEAIDEITDCYGKETWIQEINELFRTGRLGCINFGYWEYVPDAISLEIREKSQLDLYLKLFVFAGINQTPEAITLEIGCGRGYGVYLLSKNKEFSGKMTSCQKVRENYNFFSKTWKSHGFFFIIIIYALSCVKIFPSSEAIRKKVQIFHLQVEFSLNSHF